MTSKLKEGFKLKDKKYNYDDCEYCCEDEMMRDYLLSDGDGGVFIDKDNVLENDFEIGLWNCSIKYCPGCGRRL